MPTYISILRGINVSGTKKIAMTDLKALYESLALKDVITYIQSGNVIFTTNKKVSTATLTKQIEQAITEKYGFHVPVIIRTVEETAHTISANPFVKEKNIDIEKLHVTFLASKPGPENISRINNLNYAPDRFIMMDKDIYLYCPNGYGNTKLSNNFFENKLKVTATTRNWKTVNKLLELANSIKHGE